MDCIFCKIIAGEIPSSKVYEDEDLFAFIDIAPVQKGHTLLMPKKHSKNYFDTDDSVLEKIVRVAKKLAKGVVSGVGADGCTISTNNGAAAGQSVFHLHWHIIPRFTGDNLNHWPHGSYVSGEQEEYAEKIRSAL